MWTNCNFDTLQEGIGIGSDTLVNYLHVSTQIKYMPSSDAGFTPKYISQRNEGTISLKV